MGTFAVGMKKLLAIIILLAYGLSSTGMTLHLHYCCGKLDKVDFSGPGSRHCGKDCLVKNKSCCDDKQIDLKIKSEHNPGKFVQSHFDAIKALPFEALSFHPLIGKKPVPEIFAPPPLKDRTALFCVYRI
jgi:hypothetical protein